MVPSLGGLLGRDDRCVPGLRSDKGVGTSRRKTPFEGSFYRTSGPGGGGTGRASKDKDKCATSPQEAPAAARDGAHSRPENTSSGKGST